MEKEEFKKDICKYCTRSRRCSKKEEIKVKEEAKVKVIYCDNYNKRRKKKPRSFLYKRNLFIY